MQMLFLKWISRLEYYKLPLYCGLKERRQFMCFLITTFAELVFIPANLLGLNDYLEPPVFDALNWFQLAFLVVLQVAFWRNWVSIRTALYVFFIEICLKISFESLFQAIGEGGNHVMGNFSIILIISAVALSVKLPRLAFAIIAILTVDLATCFCLFDLLYMVRAMRVFFVGYLLVFFVMLYNSKTMARGLRQPRLVNVEEKKALEMLGKLNEGEKTKADSLIDRLSPESKEQLRKSVMERVEKQEMEPLVYQQLCPELTKSEIAICKLILEDKSIREICKLLGKSESNIASQRSHIRSKLNMAKHEEIKSGLEIRMLQAKKKCKNLKM